MLSFCVTDCFVFPYSWEKQCLFDGNREKKRQVRTKTPDITLLCLSYIHREAGSYTVCLLVATSLCSKHGSGQLSTRTQGTYTPCFECSRDFPILFPSSHVPPRRAIFTFWEGQHVDVLIMCEDGFSLHPPCPPSVPCSKSSPPYLLPLYPIYVQDLSPQCPQSETLKVSAPDLATCLEQPMIPYDHQQSPTGNSL